MVRARVSSRTEMRSRDPGKSEADKTSASKVNMGRDSSCPATGLVTYEKKVSRYHDKVQHIDLARTHLPFDV